MKLKEITGYASSSIADLKFHKNISLNHWYLKLWFLIGGLGIGTVIWIYLMRKDINNLLYSKEWHLNKRYEKFMFILGSFIFWLCVIGIIQWIL